MRWSYQARGPAMARKIAEKVYAVGVADPDRRTFHGHEMSTAQGTTYNAYLIVDEMETVLVDTVYEPFTDRLIENISEVIDPGRITTIVLNHNEPDHSGALPAVRALAPKAQLVCSQRGAESLAGWHHEPWPLRTVQTGDTLDTGTMTLTFIMAMMCHWPDSMMVHVGGPDVLLSNDAFGQHYTAAPFDDDATDGRLWFEAEKYFANIISPYCRNVAQRLDELEKLALPIQAIAPSHGAVWRGGAADVLAAYRRWSAQQTEARVVICYDTMYESTRRMAEAAAGGLADAGVPYTLHHLPVSDRSDVLTDLFGARGFLIGSPTWHMNVLPTVATLLDDIRTLRFKGRLVGAFGSYGWQKRNVQIIEEQAGEAGLSVPVEGVVCQWKPRPEDLETCRAFGREFAGKVTS